MKSILQSLKGLCLLMMMVGVVGFAQAQSSIVKGKVTDSQTKDPLPGATISLSGAGVKLTAIVNLDGSFTLKNVKIGNYQLVAKFIGYNPSKPYNVDVVAGKPVIVNVALQPNSSELGEVVIKANTGESDRSNRLIEKNSNTVENLLSASTIQLLPDVTVGNALQRVSGVTIQRTNNGEGRYAIIRGMEQRYNNTLVNGIKIPSPNDKYRFVPMDIFPSEMIQRLEVIKALTPSMEGDAIGGTMNLVMKTAPQRFTFSANVATGVSTLFAGRDFMSFDHSGISKLSPAEIHGNSYAAPVSDFITSNLNYNKNGMPLNTTAGITIGDRFLKNKQLGVLVAASYQNFFRGSNETFLQPNAQPTNYSPTDVNVPTFGDFYVRQYSTQTRTLGINNNIDYVFDKDNKITLYNFYSHQDEFETRISTDTTSGPNTTSTSKTLDYSKRSTWTQQDIYTGNLTGEHFLADNLKLVWKAVYSSAKKQMPDQAGYSLDGNALFTNGVLTSEVINDLKSAYHRWSHNSDKDASGYLDFTYTPTIAGQKVEFMFGGLYRHKNRDNYYNEYALVPASATTPFVGINSYPLIFSSVGLSTGDINTTNALNYTTTENTISEYGQFKFMLTDKLQVLGGVRIENTDQTYSAYNTAITYANRSGNINYTDVLPSLQVKYALTDKQNLRAAYYKAVARPGYGEIVPYLLNGEYYDEIGNPNLKHTSSDNYDVRYELYPGGADQLLLGAFYKELTNPIEYSIIRDYSKPGTQYFQPVNGNVATNWGFEAQLTKYVGMFGVSANYTYTHSAIVQTKTFINYNTTTNQTESITKDQTRPLQGQAGNVGNISLLYKNPKLSLDIQLAAVYTGERLIQVSGYYNQDFWQRPYTQLDLSFEKRIFHGFSVYGKFSNLTNSISKTFMKYSKAYIQSQAGVGKLLGQDDTDNVILQQDVYKMSFLGGVRYKF